VLGPLPQLFIFTDFAGCCLAEELHFPAFDPSIKLLNHRANKSNRAQRLLQAAKAILELVSTPDFLPGLSPGVFAT
jgi:hypothetical protein